MGGDSPFLIQFQLRVMRVEKIGGFLSISFHVCENGLKSSHTSLVFLCLLVFAHNFFLSRDGGV